MPVEKIKYNYQILFSESNTRFIVEVPKNKKENFEKFFNDIPVGLLGTIINLPKFIIRAPNGKIIINTSVHKLLSKWRAPS